MSPSLTFWNCRSVRVGNFTRRDKDNKRSSNSINLHIDYGDHLPSTTEDGMSHDVAGHVDVMLHGIDDDLLERLIGAFSTERTEDCSDPDSLPF